MATLIEHIQYHIQHYHPEKYWKRRASVIDPNSNVPKFILFFWLYRIKRCDAFNCASMGTAIGRGAEFSTPPILTHGLNGIIISYYAKIGKNVVIRQQVTIAEKNHRAATIGDNCVIGAGVKIIGGVTIGENTIIGANAVVVSDMPRNCVVAGVPAKIIRYLK